MDANERKVRMTLRGLGLCGLPVLSACAVTPENAFPEARTVGECQGQFQVAQRSTRQAMSNARTQNSGGGLLGALALGIAGGASASNNQTKLLVCLQRVGATEAEMRAAVNGGLAADNFRSAAPARATQAPARNVQPRSAVCPANGPVLFGGSQYCVI